VRSDDDTAPKNIFALSLAETQALLRGSFSPTARQDAFHKIALGALDSGKIFKREWIREVRTHEAFGAKPLTSAELSEWFSMIGFADWFWSDFPTGTPDTDEMRLMDSRFWSGLRDGIEAKKEWAFKIYAKIRFSDNESGQGKEDTAQMLEFIDKKASKWRKSVEA
jgi:hypothetical protein